MNVTRVFGDMHDMIYYWIRTKKNNLLTVKKVEFPEKILKRLNISTVDNFVRIQYMASYYI